MCARQDGVKAGFVLGLPSPQTSVLSLPSASRAVALEVWSHLEGLWRLRLLGSTPEFLRQQVWGQAGECAFPGGHVLLTLRSWAHTGRSPRSGRRFVLTEDVSIAAVTGSPHAFLRSARRIPRSGLAHPPPPVPPPVPPEAAPPPGQPSSCRRRSPERPGCIRCVTRCAGPSPHLYSHRSQPSRRSAPHLLLLQFPDRFPPQKDPSALSGDPASSPTPARGDAGTSLAARCPLTPQLGAPSSQPTGSQRRLASPPGPRPLPPLLRGLCSLQAPSPPLPTHTLVPPSRQSPWLHVSRNWKTWDQKLLRVPPPKRGLHLRLPSSFPPGTQQPSQKGTRPVPGPAQSSGLRCLPTPAASPLLAFCPHPI